MVGIVNIKGVIGDIPMLIGNEPITTFLNVIEQVDNAVKNGATSLQVFIDSPGGDVDEGDAMYDYLKGLSIPVETIALNECSSIATKVLLAGTTRLVHPNIYFMIHNPWGGSEGDADDFEKRAKELRDVENKLISDYAKDTGLSKEALKPLMKAETTLTAQQAIQFGFATGLFNAAPRRAVAYSKKLDKNTGDFVTKTEFEKMFNALSEKIEGINKVK